ncbi:glycine reductase [Enterovirga aerilata]|uniref:Glycine reductase n=1 Tax=Enterovirga aerilata TaxID=2730920 RepID=A0A849I3M1_9HYPH|nr:glycine reductase [Enterovirga sp. DB1703]NNM70975.1 glycine reductase [Enterovirga sp. DB1703]
MPTEAAHSFAPDGDVPIAYMARTRAYYAALGYETPYRWAYHLDAPFAPLGRRLSECSIALVTTAAPYQPDKGDQGPGAPYNGSAKFFAVYSGPAEGAMPDLRISHIAYDRDHTSAADLGTYFPLRQLRLAAERGRIGRVAPRFHGLPTNRSHRVTMEADAPELLARIRQDAADAAILVPNCPVCHQSATLAARHLEANGIPTVVAGCAKDIVEHAGAPRFLFSDFPLGNSAGRPDDLASQELTLELALRLLESAPGPRTTLHSPLRWSEDHAWKRDYASVEKLSPEELARRRAEFDRQKRAAKGG